ncbi:MAG: hypothetical protein KJT03_04715 [Verrucomicrobiae bacterium]|nr:hypothetical protein [Verrucomicrobiae bacterium]
MTFHHINRRLHLYLGMFCLPWFLMYGISSLAFNHNDLFSDGKGQPGSKWTETGSWNCSVAVPPEGDVPRQTVAELMKISGSEEKAYGGYRSGPGQVTVYIPSFTRMKQLVYYYNEGRLVRNERKKFASQFLTGMHARGGFGHDSFLDDSWAFVVDVVCISFVLWVISGVIMWWRVPKMRIWGAIAIAGGFLSFAGFMVWL